jgi:methylmalonyl-CoA mutase N-terminal domain/subunit
VTGVVDPLGGSYFVEALTAEMERGALAYFDTIDRMGGMVAAIERGFPQREIADSAYRDQQAVERRGRIIVGVNDFVEAEAGGVPTLYIDEAAAERQTASVRQLRRDRDNARVRRALDDLKRVAEGSGNTMEPLVDAARAYATVGEMCDALRDVWGEYEETPSI